MTDLKQKTEHFLALADAATPGPWAVHPSRAVVVPSPHASRPIGCHENPVIDLETYAQEVCALHWPDRNRNESEVRSNAKLVAAAPDMAQHIAALQAENDRLTAECDALRADAERLDWLEKQNKSTDPYRAMACVTWNIGHDWETRESLRPEIDAAMRGEVG